MCDIIDSVQEQLLNLETNLTSDEDLNKEWSDEATFENMPVEVGISFDMHMFSIIKT